MLTNAGRDAVASLIADTAAPPARFNYLALTANASAPAAADTALAGELTGGGLARAQAVYAHTAGASTFTLTKTFTTTAGDTLPVTVAKVGVLNAAAAGTLGFETLLSATATLNAVGDQLTVTVTDTLS